MKASKQIARTYARALLESERFDLSNSEHYLDEISFISKVIFTESTARQIFENPGISKVDKKQLINKIFSNHISPKIIDFLSLLIDKQRFNLLPEIHDHLARLINKLKGIAQAEVFSASELDTVTMESLKEKLESAFKEKVTIEAKVDPSLIGGLKIKVNDLLYDGSIKERLNELRRGLE